MYNAANNGSGGNQSDNTSANTGANAQDEVTDVDFEEVSDKN
jgi:hypothetical protein